MKIITASEASELAKKYYKNLRMGYMEELSMRIKQAASEGKNFLIPHDKLNDSEIDFLITKGFKFRFGSRAIYW